MKKLLKFIKRLFRSKFNSETIESIKQIEADGEERIKYLSSNADEKSKQQEQVVNDLMLILEEQHQLEIDKNEADVKATVQQKIAEVKQQAIDIKEKEKSEKIKQVKLWLESV